MEINRHKFMLCTVYIPVTRNVVLIPSLLQPMGYNLEDESLKLMCFAVGENLFSLLLDADVMVCHPRNTIYFKVVVIVSMLTLL